MSLFIAGFIVILLFLVALGALTLTAGRRPRSVLMASLAGRWNGRVAGGGFLTGDRLELRVDDVAGEVLFAEDPQSTWESAGWTRVRFDWPSERRMRVSPEAGASAQFRRLCGASDIEFDDPAFDDRFFVESSHPTWARGLLDSETRRTLVRLQWSPRGPFSDRLTVDVGPSGVSMSVSRVLVDHADSLGALVETCISVLQKVKARTESTGIRLEMASVVAGSACPVCGHPVAGEVLPCPACRTPHHRDCWRYFGGCAIFGCRTRVGRS